MSVHRLHGIGNQIDEHLEKLRGICLHRRDRLIFTHDFDLMTDCRESSHFDSLVKEIGKLNQFSVRT